MNRYISIFAFLILGFSASVSAQKVWTDPAEVTDPTDSVKIFIDMTQMDCDKLVGWPDPVYIWTWLPADPVAGNGSWDASNTDHAWKSEGNDIWSFTILPTDFYGVTAQDVYDNDIHFLAKGLDGGSGGDCSSAGDENKTEDLMVEVNQPGPLVQKIFGFPAPSDGDTIAMSQDDIFTFFYENSLEEKASMQSPGDLYVYARAYDTDGTQYRPEAISTVGTNPALKMNQEGTLYDWQIRPAALFAIPNGKTLDYMRLQVMKPVVVDSDDAVDGTNQFFLKCN